MKRGCASRAFRLYFRAVGEPENCQRQFGFKECLSHNEKRQAFRLAFLVRETGLEPVRCNHTPLKRARLPVPPLSHEHKVLYTRRGDLSRGFGKFFLFFWFYLFFPIFSIKSMQTKTAQRHARFSVRGIKGDGKVLFSERFRLRPMGR